MNVKSRKRDDGSVLEAQVVWDLSYTDLSFVPFRKARVDKRQMNLTKRPRVDPMIPAVDRLCHAACLSGRCSPSEARQLPPRFDNAFDPAPAYTCRRMGFFERRISPCRGVALLSLSINAIPGGVEPSCHTATVV